jgi:hypothetical protein
MRYAVLAGLLAVLVAAVANWPTHTRSVEQLVQAKRIEPGQSSTEVRAALGEPAQINKTDTYWKTTEDWIYPEGDRTFLLTFEAGKLLQITERLVGAGN